MYIATLHGYVIFGYYQGAIIDLLHGTYSVRQTPNLHLRRSLCDYRDLFHLGQSIQTALQRTHLTSCYSVHRGQWYALHTEKRMIRTLTRLTITSTACQDGDCTRSDASVKSFSTPGLSDTPNKRKAFCRSCV